MKKIEPSDFPKHLTNNDYNSLVDLVRKNPLSELWKQVSSKLTAEQKVEINRRLDNYKYSESKLVQQSRETMSDEEWDEKRKSIEANKFYGNMGQPETPQEFKNRYGVWPPGYDKNGNKL